MYSTPVPLPSGAPDAPAWLSTDAEEWARLRPAPWAWPVWSVLALIGTVGSAMAVSPDAPCSEAAPCGPDWGGMTEVGLAVGLLFWLVKLPELVLITAPVLAAVVAWLELQGADGADQAVNAAVIAALAFGWASARERLAARGRQRRLAEQAAGLRHGLSEFMSPLPRGGLPIAAAVILCVVAAVSVAMGLRGIRADEDHAAHATRTTARVIHRGEDSIRLRTGDARHLTVDAVAPEDYRVGGTVTVLEDDSWRRLAAEPYDALAWQLLTLATVLPGLSLLTVGILARRRTASQHRTPLPALRVLQHTDRTGELRVYATDDPTGSTPLLECSVLPTPPPPDGSLDLFDSDESPAAPQLREAVMFGAPTEGADLVFVTTGRDAAPTMLITWGPVRRPRKAEELRRQQDQADMNKALESAPEPHPSRPSHPSDPSDPESALERGAANLKPTGEPMRWGPGRVARACGLAFALFAGLQAWDISRSLMTEGFGLNAIRVFGLFPPIHIAATLLNWRVTADSTGLWLNGAWRLRHVPWERLRGVTYKKEGKIEIRLPEGETWGMPFGSPAAERRLRIRPSYVRLAEEVNALHLHPELRPTTPAHPQDRGRPAGPLLLVAIVLHTVFTITG